MEKIKSYKDLIVWQKSIDLAAEVYELTVNFPNSEIYGLTSQIKRCAVSIPSNIAEGRKRGSRNEYCYHLTISLGSCAELETQFEIVKRLPFGKNLKLASVENLLIEIMKMLNKMISKLKENA